jgi:cephalosporin-C deacetylase
MPRTDMQRDELLAYSPRVEVPADLEAFWDETLAGAARLPLATEVIDSGPVLRGVRCARIAFDGSGGERIRGWYVRPGGGGPFPAAVCYHGYGGRGSRPLELYPLAAQGVAVVSIDCRGQGGEVADLPADGYGHARGWLTKGIRSPLTYYYRTVYTDAVRALEVVASLAEVDAGRIAVTGPSQGGGLALAAAALSRRPSLVWADIPFLCHFERAVDIAVNGPYPEIADFLRRCPDQEETVWRTLAYFDNLVLAPWVTAPTVVTAGLWDDICPPSTIFPTFARLGAQDKRLQSYPCLGHELSYEIDEARLLTLVERLAPGTQ